MLLLKLQMNYMKINSNFKIRQLIAILEGINICLTIHDPSAYIIFYILYVEILQLHLQSVLICLVNVTLTTKSALHTSQFAKI